MYKLVKLSSTMVILSMLISGCEKNVPIKTAEPTQEPTKKFEAVIPTKKITPTPSPSPTITVGETSSPSPTLTIEPTSSSGITTFSEAVTISQDDIGQILVAKFRVDGKDKRAFCLIGSDGNLYDLFAGRIMFIDLPDKFIPSDEMKIYMKGSFKSIGCNGLRTYLKDIGVDKPLSELHSQRDLRLLYEQIVPQEQWFAVPWDADLNGYSVGSKEEQEKVLGKRN